MKKFAYLLMITMMVLCLIACSATLRSTEPITEMGEASEDYAEAKYPSFALVANDTIGDRGFVDMSYAGIQATAERYDIDWKFFSCNNDSSVYLDTLKAAAENYDVIFVIPGYFFDAELKKVQALYPDRRYIYIDGNTDIQDVTSCSFSQNEGAFLAGVLAANLSKNGKVGFVGGADMAVIHDYEVGFKQGVEYVKNGTQVIVRYTNDHYDAALGKVTAHASFEEGADVIFQAAGPAGLGVLEAAAEYGFTAIGVDTDQCYLHPGFIASSMLKRVDNAVEDMAEELCNGETLPKVSIYNIANGGISLADNEYYQSMVSEEIRNKVKEASAAVADGTVKVISYFD